MDNLEVRPTLPLFAYWPRTFLEDVQVKRNIFQKIKIQRTLVAFTEHFLELNPGDFEMLFK